MNGMVSCKSCTTQNSLDSAFCKKCGATLPADEIQQAREKLESVVADGFRVFSAGRTDEAIQIAETAVLANPTSTAALSLKAMCHERLGQISEALECHERVLAIDPDSMIDKIKVNDLRNLLVARTSIAAIPDRRMPIVSAVAAVVLILSIGVVLARNSSHSQDAVASNSPTTNLQPKGSGVDQPATSQSQVQPQSSGITSTTGGASPIQNSALPQSNANSGRRAEDGTVLPNVSKDRDGVLPSPLDGSRPVTITVEGDPPPTNGNTKPVQAPSKSNSTVDADPPPTIDPVTPLANQEAPGIMDIQVTSGKGQRPGDSSDPSSHPNGVQALLRTARTEFQTRNYQGAATSYERALRAGANPGTGNQRLAECYEQLGRTADAMAAYNRAIEALQSDIDAGRGDKARLSAALDVCKQAVKVLGG